MKRQAFFFVMLAVLTFAGSSFSQSGGLIDSAVNVIAKDGILSPGENGLPIEIYVFSNDQEWANYEAIQADIFDHILAVVPSFDLRLFQHPTGSDFQALAKYMNS